MGHARTKREHRPPPSRRNAQRSTGSTASFSSTFPDRLRRIIETVRLSGVARSASGYFSVKLYLLGSKPPAKFLAALVRDHGVNPEWLLCGRGAPFIVEEVAQTRLSVAELVQALVRLIDIDGLARRALAQRTRAGMLAQLRDIRRERDAAVIALDRLVKVRIEALLGLLRANIQACNFRFAIGIDHALGQLEPLCRTTNLRIQYSTLHSHLCHYLGNAIGAAREFAKTFALIVQTRGDSQRDFAAVTANLVVGQYSLRRFDEVERFASSILPQLASSAGSKVLGETGMVCFVRASAALERGESAQAHLRQLFCAARTFNAPFRAGTYSNQLYALLISGRLGVQEAIQSACYNTHRLDSLAASHLSSVLLRHAVASERVDDLQQACAFSTVQHNSESPERDIFADAHARAALAILQNEGNDVARLFVAREAVAKHLLNPPSQLHLTASIACCQLLILAGDWVAAWDEFRRSQHAIDSAGRPHPERLIYIALHHRNAVRLAAQHDDPWLRKRGQQAQVFFTMLKDNGFYGLLNLRVA